MKQTTFRAMVVTQAPDNHFTRKIRERAVSDLPDGDVLVAVHYSSLNYKDALSATGNKGVTRAYPHTPGIDASGKVLESRDPAFKPGDAVIVTSYDLGMNTSGGFGGCIRVPAGWVVPLPAGLSLKESMMLGTAGFTAGLSVQKLIDLGVTPEKGEVLVTGATGGVGSLAVAILSQIGFRVWGASGKPDAERHLKALGAQGVLSRQELLRFADRPLLKARWAGVVDTVGGPLLAAAVKSTLPWGAIACCGNAASFDLPLTVFPFILRGVTLSGIDSQNCPMPLRKAVWEKLAGPWKPAGLEAVAAEVDLDGLSPLIDRILEGGVTGRYVVRVAA